MPTGSSTGSPPPVSRGGRCCRSARPTATARRTSQARRSRPGAGCWRRRALPCRGPQIAEFRERQRFWIGDWERFAGRRRGRRPGALRARVARAAGVRQRAGRADHGRRGDLRLARERRPPRPPAALPGRLCGRRAARRLRGAGPAVGQPAVRLAGAPTAAGTAGGSSGCAARWSLFDLARIDHFRGFVAYWAVPAGARTAVAGTWRRGPGKALFEALERSLGADLPLVAEDLGVITPPVRRLRDRARPARDARAPVRDGSAPSAQPAPAREPRGQPGRLHGHARSGHDPGLARVTAAAAAGVRRLRARARRAYGSPPAVVGDDPARALLAGVPGHDPGPGSCSGSAARRG